MLKSLDRIPDNPNLMMNVSKNSTHMKSVEAKDLMLCLETIIQDFEEKS